MNAKQEAKLNMYRAVEQHCDANPSIIGEVTAFGAAFIELKVVIGNLVGTEQLVGSPIVGITLGKVNSKQTLAELGAGVAAPLYALAVVLKSEMLKEQANFNFSKLYKTRDDELAPLCQNIHDRANENMPLIKDYGVDAQKLTDLQNAITNYAADVPKPRTARSNRKTQVANLNDLFRQGDAILKDRMDKLVGALRANHPDFVATYESTRIIVDPAKTVTQLKGKVTNAADDKPIKNATITATTPAGVLPVVTKTTKTAPDGKYRIKPIPPGTYDITVTAPGFVTFTDETVEIKMGEITTVNAEMEAT